MEKFGEGRDREAKEKVSQIASSGDEQDETARFAMPQASRTPSLKLVEDSSREIDTDSRGEPEKFEPLSVDELYRRYAPYVAAIASRILGREGEVQDVVQDVFASAVNGLRFQEEPNQVRGWLAKVAVRTSMRKLRARNFWSLFDLAESPQYECLADEGAGPHERQLVAEVYQTLDSLAAKERVAWVLRYVEGESLEDAARLCDCSLATVKRRIAKAHSLIRDRLDGTPTMRRWEQNRVD